MDWYPRYPALWRAKTMHLTPFQDGCYMRLVDHYMETRQPLPDNDVALARIIGIPMTEWQEHACGIVRAFFKVKNGLLKHDTCEDVLHAQDGRASRMSEKGKKGAKARWNNNKYLNGPCMAQAMPADAIGQDRTGDKSNRPKGLLDDVPLKSKKSWLIDFPLPTWLPVQIWKDWIDHRKSMRKPLTQKSASLCIAELTSFVANGHDPIKIVNTSIMRGWQGLFEPKTERMNWNHVNRSTQSYSDGIQAAMSGAERTFANIERGKNDNEIPY